MEHLYPNRATQFIADPENSSIKPVKSNFDSKIYGFPHQGTMAILDAHGKVSQETCGVWARLTVLVFEGIDPVRSL